MKICWKWALCAILALPAAGVSAATIDFDGAARGTHTNYVEDGFVLDKVRMVKARCEISKPCAAKNRYRDATLTMLTGGLFNVNSMWIRLINATPVTLTTNKGSMTLGVGSALGSDTIVARRGYTVDLSENGFFRRISFLKIVDSSLGEAGTGGMRGNLRFDDIKVAPAPVPLPASGVLMIAGLGGLAFLRRRKRA